MMRGTRAGDVAPAKLMRKGWRWAATRARARDRARRFLLESLEDRAVPAVFNISSGVATDLVAAINSANTNGDPSNTINLTGTYTLTSIDNYWYGPTGLPAITSNLTISGNTTTPTTIQRSTDVSTPNFRLFYVAAGQSGVTYGTLSLNNLTLAGGVAQGGNAGSGGGGMGAGGAIFNMGTVALNGVTITNSLAVGGSSGYTSGAGGGGIGSDDDGNNGGGFGGVAPGAVGGAGGSGIGGTGGGSGFNASDSGTTSGSGGNGGGSGNLGGATQGGGTYGDGGGGSGEVMDGAAGGSFGAGGESNGVDSGGGGVGGGGGGGGNAGGGGFGGGGGGNPTYGGGNAGGNGGFGGGGGASNPINGGGSGGWGAGSGGSALNGQGGGGGGAGLGGAIFNFTGNLSVVNSTIASNQAVGGNATWAGQPGGAFGGGVFNLNGTVTLVNATFAANTVTSGYHFGSGTGQTAVAADGIDVYNLAFGREWREGAGFTKGDPVSATLQLANTLLASSSADASALATEADTSANSSGTGSDSAVVNAAIYNIMTASNVVRGVTGTITTGFVDTTTVPPLNSAGLADNGGPTFTIALDSQLNTSIAPETSIFGLTVPTVDQRGIARPTATDLGAYQIVSAPTATLDSATNINAATGSTSTTTVVVTYTDQSGSGINTATLGTGNISVNNGATVTGYFAASNTVTYTITAPSSDWASSTQGTYTVALVAGSVMDNDGNGIAGDASFGSFQVDTVAPTATLTSAPTVNASDAAANTTTVTITYSDTTSGIDTSTFGTGNITVNNGATVTGYSAVGNVVTYTITAPSADWSSSTQGSYTIALVAGSVKDLAGNGITGDASFGSFLVDTVAPTATLTLAPTVTASDASSTTTTVTVTYSDATSGIDTSTFGIGNITVSDGATVTGYSAVGNVVTYTITAPSSDWGSSTQGSYTIAIVSGSVKDLAGNGITGDASFGSFLVDTVAPTATLTSAPTVDASSAAASTTTVTITYADTTSGIDTSTFGIGNITVSDGATVTGYSAVGNVVTYTITSPSSDWGSSTQGTYTVALVADSVKDLAGNGITGDASFGSFIVDTVAPTATLTSAPTVTASDASSTTTTVTITYSDATSGIDTSTFGTGNITVSDGATVTGYSAVGNVVTYTITAPSSDWGSSTQGTYTVALVADSVKDLVGNGITGDASFGSFIVDTVAPTASLTSAPTVTASQGSSSTTTVTITYADAVSGIDTSTFGIGNITVGNGATVTGYSAVGNVVTYTIASPSTDWSSSTQGSYTISLVDGAVKDLAGNGIAGDASFGSFLVDTVAPTAVLTSAPTVNSTLASASTTTVTVTYSDATSGIDTSTFGTGNITVDNGATVTGYSAVGNVVTYTITAPATDWGSSTQGNYTIALVAGSVKDLAGNGITGNASFGSFLVDTVAPTASLTSAPTVNAAAGSSSTTTVSITYADSGAGIDDQSFGTENITVSNGATVTGYSAVGNVVTYTITAPSADWSSSTQGSYTIAIVAGSVTDLVGNGIAGDASFGSFLVDTVLPTATLTSAPTVNATSASASTTTVTVTYADTTSGIDTSTFGLGNITVSNGATVTGYTAVGDVVTYTITAPSSDWGSSTQGTYTVALVADSVKDLAGNGITGDASFGSFIVDTVAPTATLTSAPTVTASDASSTTTTVTITYSDATSGIDTSTFGIGNITVSDGATVTGYSAVGNVVTYTITAPSSDWGSSTQGSYTIAIVDGSVKDLAGNGITGDASFGSFLVDTVAPTATLTSAPTVTASQGSSSTTTVTITYADSVSGIDTSTFGIGNITVGNGATVTSYSAVGNAVTYTITSPSTDWSSSTQGSYTIALVDGSVKDLAGNGIAGDASFGSFLVNTMAPTATLTSAPTVNASDASSSTTTVTITYADATSGIDTSTFGLGNITVSNGATVTGYSAVGNVVTYTITAPSADWGSSTQGSYTIAIVDGSVKDNAGNGITGDASFGSFLVDTVAPTASLTSSPTVDASSAAASTTTVTVTYADTTSGIDSSTFGIGNITVSDGATVTGYTAVGNVVTYTITAPSLTWGSSTQGSYTIALVDGSVKDLAGNGIAGDASFGSFLVDTVAPTATLTSAPTVNSSDASSSMTTVTVTYSDATSGIDSSTFGIGNITVNNGATVTGYTAVGNVVTYTITAPSLTWGGSTQGTYTVSLVADSVKDNAGNGVAGDASFGSFLVDTVAPTATLTSAPTVNASDASSGTTTLTITYADTTSGIDTSTFGIGNITVSDGATVTGYTAVGNVVTYTITSPSLTWGSSTQGTYTVALVAGSVKDNAGNGIAGDASFGSFLVDTMAPTATLTSAPTVNAAGGLATTTTVTIDYADMVSGIDSTTFGVGNITVSNGATVTGYTAVGNVVTYTITAPSSNWASSTQGTYTIALVAGAVKDLAGNGIVGDASFGSFLVDTVFPSATLTSAPAVNASSASASTTTVTLTYSDTISGIDTSTFGTGNITVNNGATVTGYSAVGNAVTYTITAPSSDWAGSTQGYYTIGIVAGSVKDLAGNSVPPDAHFGSFMVDTVLPTATLVSAPTVNADTTPENQTTVTVTYGDSVSGINPDSLGTGNITVSNGATVTGYTAVGNTVTYTITAPSSSWATSTQGTYTISLVDGSVTDYAGNGIAGVSDFGSFLVDTVPPTATVVSAPPVNAAQGSANTTTVTITYSDAISGIDTSTFGTDNIRVGNMAVVTGYSVSGNTVTYTVTAPGSDWASSPQGTYYFSVIGGKVKDNAGNLIAGVPLIGSFTVDVSVRSVTSTTLLAEPSSASFGQSIMLNAMIAGGSEALQPGGSVTFYDGNTALATVTVGPDGTASYMLSDGLAVGTHSITASYGGDTVFAPSVSPAVSVTVSQSTATAGTVASSSSQVFYGQSVTLTATFQAPSNGTTPMTGTVSFYDGSTLLGTAPITTPLAGMVTQAATTTGQASLLATLSAGDHVITAVYSGDANYAPASSTTTASVVVAQATTSTTLDVYVSGNSANLLAQVVPTSPGPPNLTGTVVFLDNGVPVGSAPLVNGAASLTLTNLAPGVHHFTAAFPGGQNATTSGSTATTAVVSGGDVIDVARYGYHWRPTTLVLTVAGDVDPAIATNPARYILTGRNFRGRPGRQIPVAAATYNAQAHTITLSFHKRLPLHQTYTLSIPDIGYTTTITSRLLAGQNAKAALARGGAR